MAWSYELLDDSERLVLGRSAVFAGGFDLAAAAHLGLPLDEYAVLDIVDSLVRKSLVTVDRVPATPATGCSKPSVSSPKSNWRRPAT